MKVFDAVAACPHDHPYKEFLGRFNNYYTIEFKPLYRQLEEMMTDCVRTPNKEKCHQFSSISFTEAFFGRLTYMNDADKPKHNAMVDTTINALNAFAGMNLKQIDSNLKIVIRVYTTVAIMVHSMHLKPNSQTVRLIRDTQTQHNMEVVRMAIENLTVGSLAPVAKYGIKYNDQYDAI